MCIEGKKRFIANKKFFVLFWIKLLSFFCLTITDKHR